MVKKHFLKKALLALACVAFSGSSLAQWQWVDKDGRKVFSDRAPPSDIAAKNILAQPAPKVVSPVTDGAAAAPVAPSPVKLDAPRPPAKDTQLEAKRKQAADEEAVRKKAEQEKMAKDRVGNCERATKALVAMKSGVRISLVNAKGEREFMDDASRAAETKRLESVAQSDCAN